MSLLSVPINDALLHLPLSQLPFHSVIVRLSTTHTHTHTHTHTSYAFTGIAGVVMLSGGCVTAIDHSHPSKLLPPAVVRLYSRLDLCIGGCPLHSTSTTASSKTPPHKATLHRLQTGTYIHNQVKYYQILLFQLFR